MLKHEPVNVCGAGDNALLNVKVLQDRYPGIETVLVEIPCISREIDQTNIVYIKARVPYHWLLTEVDDD